MPGWAPYALVLLAAAASYMDARFRRIPNALVLLTLVTGTLIRGLSSAPFQAVGSSVAAAVAAVALLWIPWSRGGLGGGDVKLAAGFASWFGLGHFLHYALAVALAGGLVSLITFLVSPTAVRREVAANLKLSALTESLPEAPLAAPGRKSVPYGVAIGIGTLVTYFYFVA